MAQPDITTTAKLLWPHLDANSWRGVAEITHPGVTSRIASVLAGDADTSVLPAEVAVRLVSELDGDAARAAVGGDRRATVRAAIGATAPATKRSPKLLAGTPEQVVARLEKRSRVGNVAQLDEYLQAPVAVRDAAAAHLLCIGTRQIAAAVLCELATRGRALATVRLAIAGATAGTLRGGMNHWRLQYRIADAAELAARHVGMAVLLSDVDDNDSKDTDRDSAGTDDAGCDNDTTAVELGVDITLDDEGAADLASAAVYVGRAVRCSATAATAAARRVADSSASEARDRYRLVAAFVTAGASGARWDDVAGIARNIVAAGAVHAALNAALASDVDGEYLADAINSLFDDRNDERGRVVGRVATEVLERCGNRVDVAAVMRMSRAAGTTGTRLLLRWLAGHHGGTATAAEVRAALDAAHGPADTASRSELARIGLDAYVLSGITATDSCAEALEPVWDALLDVYTCSAIIGACARSASMAGLAARFAARTNDAIGAQRPADPSGLWAAICTLAGTFDGTIDELVAVATETSFSAAA